MGHVDEVTDAERAAAEGLEAALRPAIVAAWHASPGRGPGAAIVAGYADHISLRLERDLGGIDPNAVIVCVTHRHAVADALLLADEYELAAALGHCDPEAIPVMLCARSHVAMVYLHRAPSGATVVKGGRA